MDIKQIISKLTFDEKLNLLTGKNVWETVEVERLGIPSITVSDGPHGLRKEYIDSNNRTRTHDATCFPTSSAMAATWNRNLINRIGKALAEQCIKMNVDILLGPAINIKRIPLCGRNFEYFSEDPYLAGELSAEYINGVQSLGIGTCLKHFAANNQEYDRHYISSDVDIRTLREIYLKPFEIAVKKSKPWAVMCAYNRLNGIYCSENKFLLNGILRDEWDFKGIVISDWGAVYNRTKALQATLELEMPFSAKSKPTLKEAYDKMEITDIEIDSAVERLLDLINKIMEQKNAHVNNIDLSQHDKLAKEAALESITLLKNDDNILPISKNNASKIAVIGQYAKEPIIQGDGSSHVYSTKIESPLDEIIQLVGKDFEIKFSHAYSTHRTMSNVDNLRDTLINASTADVAIVFVGNNHTIETESYDRCSMKLESYFEKIILRVASKNPNTIVVIQAGSAIDMSSWIDKVKGVVFTWYAGQSSGSATAEVLFGRANPCGKIAETFPLEVNDTPSYLTYPSNGTSSWYLEGIMVGYRFFDTINREVLFPFGHGLSYTNFEYSDLQISPMQASEDDEIYVQFKIKNTGNFAGKEIVQLYISDISTKVLRPEKELKNFDKVYLQPREEKLVNLKLDKSSFMYFNTSLNTWHLESGIFHILIGASSRDIRLKGEIIICSSTNFS